MESLGEKLKQARIAKNLSIEEVHKITKINRNYLAALETSNVKAFPAEVYYKNFLKRYASYLGLNGEQILQEYNDSKKQQESKVIHKKNSSKEKKARNKKDFFIPIILIILILILFLMNYFIKTDAQKTEHEIDDLISVNNVYDKKHEDKTVEDKTAEDETIKDKKTDTENNKVVEQPEQKPEPETNKQESSVNKTAEEKPKIQQEKPQTVTPAPKVPKLPEQRLFVRANNDTWIDVSADGKSKYKGFVFKGQDSIYYADEFFTIKIGDVSGVEVFFNDNPVDILSGANENNVNTLELKK
ncbi:helix-turn-helix domain-containing protein [Candidatus Ruminimicrobium bovinum]|uniref:helix-turn-helix domain-containing protein n=1 Tax=Candidatus Ruminimicrobium bovinum TaxID=3242779 RepID=UPI0039B87B65